MKRIPTNLRLMLAALFAVCLGVSAWAGFSSMFTPSVSYPESASVAPAQPAAPAPAKVKAAAPAIDFTAAGNYQLLWTEVSETSATASADFANNTDSPWGFYRYNVADGTYTRFATYSNSGNSGNKDGKYMWYSSNEYCFVSESGHYHPLNKDGKVASPAIVFTAPADGIYFATITVWRDKADKTNPLVIRSRVLKGEMKCDKADYIFAKGYGTKAIDGDNGKVPQTLDFYIRLNSGQKFTFETEAYTAGKDDDGRTHISNLSVASCKAANQPFTLEEAQAYDRFYDATAPEEATINYAAEGNYHLLWTEANASVATAAANFNQNTNSPWGFYRYTVADGTYAAFTTCDQSGKNGNGTGRGDAWYSVADEYCFVSNTGHFHSTADVSPAVKFTAPADGIYFATITVFRDKPAESNTLYLRSRYLEAAAQQCDNETFIFEQAYGTIATDNVVGTEPQTLDFFIRMKQGTSFTFESYCAGNNSAARTHISDLAVASCRDTGTPFTIDEAKAYARFYDAVGEEQPTAETYVKITSAQELESGKKYLIVYDADHKAMGQPSTSYYTIADVAINNNTITNPAAEVQRVVIEADQSGALYTLKVSETSYLMKSNGNKNECSATTDKTKSEAQWTIQFNNTDNALIYNNQYNAYTLQYNANSGQERFTCYKATQKLISLYKESAGGTTPTPVVTVTPPVIQPESGTFFGEKEVTITADQGDEIWYSLNDGADQQYTAPFTVSETTKVTAYAKDNAGNESTKVTNTLTFGPSYATCAAANAAATATKVDVCVTLTDALVTYVVPDPNNNACAYVEDATGGFLIYGSHKFEAGQKFTGSIEGQLYTYHGTPEIEPTGYTDLSVTSSDNTVVPAEVDAAELAANPLTYVSRYVMVKPAKFAADALSNRNVNFTVGSSNFVLRDNFATAPTFNTEADFTVAGLVTIYDANTQLYPTKAEDVAEMAAAPALGYGDISTAALANPSFELSSENTPLTADLKASNAALNIYGWTEGGVGNQFNNTEVITASSTSSSAFGVATPSDGSYDLFFRQGWNSNTNPTVVTLTAQTLTVLPAGSYQLFVDYKQTHSSNNDHPSGNTTVAIALQSGETSFGTATSAAAPAGSDTYFADSEWNTLTANVTIANDAQPDVVVTLTAAGGIRSDFFIDNVRLIRLSEADIARAELKAAIEPAEAIVTTPVNVGDGLFQYPLEALNAYSQAVAEAKNVADNINATAEQLNAAKQALEQATQAYTVTTPDPNQAYNLMIKEGDTYMTLDDGTKQAASPADLFFEAIEGGFAITDGNGNYVAKAGSNPWNMNASTTPFAWTINCIADGEYTIAQAADPTKFIGIDNPATAGNKCYANKGSNDNITWLISQAAPHFQATAVDVYIERMVGQGTTAQTETIDFAAAKAYLGVDELKPYMVDIINPDGVVEFDYAQFGGWFDTTGKATSETDLGNNPGICLNFPEALTNGTFSVSDKNGADVVGQTYTVKWEFQANSRGYIYRFHISFVESTQPQVADGADVAAENAAAVASVTAGQFYRIFTQDDSGTKYYMTTDGFLTDNVDDAAVLPLKLIERSGSNAINIGDQRYDLTAFKFDARYTNPLCTETGPIDAQGHIMINNNASNNNRDDYESQVFFLGAESGKYAVRATAKYNVGSSGQLRYNAHTYWTTTDTNLDGKPEAEYGYDPDYRWQLEEPDLQLNDGDDLALENAAAVASVTEGHSYRVFTQNSAGTKFYLTADGYLTANEKEAAVLPMKLVSRTGSNAVNIGDQRYDVTAFKLGAYTNPKCSEFGDFEPQGHIMIYTGGAARDDYESQVFFLGAESGKYAVRATAKYNVNSSGQLRWSAHTFWTTTGSDELPEAEYSLTPNYCWQLEDAAYEIPSDFPNPDITYTIKNSDADLYMSFDTSQDRVVLSENPVELSFESDGNGGWYITDGASYFGLDGGWYISASADKKSPVTLSAITSGDDILFILKEANGVVGTDNLEAGQKCYSDKTVANHGYWILTAIEPLPEVAIYSKVTSAEGLVPGAKYLMVNEEASVALGAISTTSTKYGLPVDVTIANSRITITDEEVDVLTLGASGSNWTFASSLAEGYLNWTSGNSLTLSTEAEANAQWTITFDADGNATLANVGTTARILSYNTTDPRFATYGNMGQKRVQLYKAGKPASGYGTDFVFNDEGIQSFGLAGNKNITPEDNTNNVINVTKNDIKDGIVVKYDNVDIEGVETHLSGFCASAKVTDQKGNTFLVKSKGNDNNVIYVAKGLFGPNEEYEVIIQPIVYYNYDQFCDGIYELWENEKENHKIMEADGKSWHLDPAWTLSAAAQQWSQNLKASGSIAYNGDVVNFDYCDPLPYYVDNTPHKFIIKTDNTVTSNVKALGTQDFKAFDVWGNDITAEYLSALEGGTATAIDGIEGSQDADGRIYNMAGQRVAKTTKGLYIVNGKKVAVK